MADTRRETWDAIVIGSGLGGLSCAAYLCASGKRTLVLESHYIAGGNSQVFRRRYQGRDYEFDVGLHYIGECGAEGTIARVLRGAGLERRVKFRAMDADGFSTLLFPDLTFRVPAGWDRYRDRLFETFPEEREGLARVIEIMREVAESGRRIQNREIAPEDILSEAPNFLIWGIRPITELFEECGISERAAAVILGEQAGYGVRPSRTAVALQAGYTDHFMRGAFYPEGGGQVIAARLVEAVRAYGGEVRTRALVDKVRIENGRVAGVALAASKSGEAGALIDAPVVVSNADLKRTVRDLVGVGHFSSEIAERVDGYRMSLPLFIVYLGLDIDLGARGLPNSNYFIWDSYDVDGIWAKLEEGEIPDETFAYMTIASAKDPDSRHLAPQGYSNLQIMTTVPREYAVWNVEKGPVDGASYHRDSEYRRRKDELADRLIAMAQRVIPELSDHIDWKETASPLTHERFTRSSGGTGYGIELATDQMGPMRIGPETELPGLFVTGASTFSGHGISNVLRGGVVAAGAALGENLMARVLAGETLADPGLLPELSEGEDWDPWRESH